ncbi:conjugal transfer protein TrbL family protein [Bacillus pumilus]|uniref:conjugal transfer protein TrbL family protein n=1 Tax=Bacillus pumilus TaxID=1408 RepID=UPI003305F611
MFDWIKDGLKDSLNGIVEHALGKWIESIMNWVLQLINGIVFKIPENAFVTNIFNFLSWFTSAFVVVVALYKIVEYLLNSANGTQQYPLDEIFLRVFKSAGALLVLPWIFKLVVMDIALPIANYFAAAGTDFDGKGGYTVMTGTVVGAGLGIASGGIILILIMVLFAVALCSFFFSVCVFYADYVMMQILIAPVALSMMADDNNYFNVWWRELLSMITALLVKIFLVTVIINVLFTGGGFAQVGVAIGCAVLLIKSPSILKNMWYGGGSSRAMARGGGRMASMGSNMVITQFLR